MNGLDARTILGFVVLLIVVAASFLTSFYLIKSGKLTPIQTVGLFAVQSLFILCLIIALGHVTQDQSYGLGEGIGGLIGIATQFAAWAFAKPRDPNEGQ